MIKRTQEQWRSLFTEHQASGLKAIDFCKQHNICPNYFSKRRKELLSPDKKSSEAFHFVSVTPTTQTGASSLSLQYQHTVITLPTTVSPDWLASLLQHLKA